MVCRIFIENPPPFIRAHCPDRGERVDVPVAEGLATARCYLAAGLSVAGFHHSDLDRYEASRIRGEEPPERHDSFAYARALKAALGGFGGLLIPHRVTIYQQPAAQEAGFRSLLRTGIKDVVLVGRPFSKVPDGVVYRSTVEEGLVYIRNRIGDLPLNVGVIGIHSRSGEADRIVGKFEAAGGRLRVMGQFLDEVDAMTSFMDRLAHAFEAKGLDLAAVEWNVGLAIFALKNRAFYARLLRKERLACEGRFVDLVSMDERIAESVATNLEFAQRVREHGGRLGIDIGFSVQPLIERAPSGAIHPAVYGAIDLARRLQNL